MFAFLDNVFVFGVVVLYLFMEIIIYDILAFISIVIHRLLTNFICIHSVQGLHDNVLEPVGHRFSSSTCMNNEPSLFEDIFKLILSADPLPLDQGHFLAGPKHFVEEKDEGLWL